MELLTDYSLLELKNLLAEWGEPSYRAMQIWQGVYKQYWNTPEEFTQLPSALRDRLKSEFVFDALISEKTIVSDDGQAMKSVFRTRDGLAIETVFMNYDHRQTLCISTQAGCAMGCVFCATGQMGFKRHLTKGEIIAQVLHFERKLRERKEKLTNIVVMGMGEPFHNYANTMGALGILNDPNGRNFGARRFTISTVGLVPAIRKFTAEDLQYNLAISLHSANDKTRAQLLPIARKYPLSELMLACHEYVDKTRRRITFEWALIDGITDSVEQANRLADLLKRMLCHVNAIPLNSTAGYDGQKSTALSAERFKTTLLARGIACTIRLRRGFDIQAGCGQLASEEYRDK